MLTTTQLAMGRNGNRAVLKSIPVYEPKAVAQRPEQDGTEMFVRMDGHIRGMADAGEPGATHEGQSNGTRGPGYRLVASVHWTLGR